MPNNQDATFNKLFSQLENKYKTDTNFQKEIDSLTFFYERKLLRHAKNDDQASFIVSNFREISTSLYLHGYYVMTTLLSDSEVQIDNDTWSMSPGYVRNEIPKQLDTIFKDVDVEWSYTEIGHRFGMDILQRIEAAYDIFKQTRIDIAAYGAYKAFIEDERYKGNTTDNTKTDMLLGNPFDLQFLSPQVYYQAQFKTAEQEIWTLNSWASNAGGGTWVGSCDLSRIETDNHTLYLLRLSILNTITAEEKLDLANEIIGNLPEEIQAMLQTTLYHVDNVEVLVKTEENDM